MSPAARYQFTKRGFNMTLKTLLQIVLTLANLAVCGGGGLLVWKRTSIFKKQIIAMIAVVFFIAEILLLKAV